MLYSSASIRDFLGGRFIFDENCFLRFHSKILCQYCLLYLIPEETENSSRHAKPLVTAYLNPNAIILIVKSQTVMSPNIQETFGEASFAFHPYVDASLSTINYYFFPHSQ